MSDTEPRVDVAILTFREDELAAVLERFPSERIVDGRRMYNISRVPLEGGDSYSVAITQCVETTGSSYAAEAVRNILEDVAPSLMLMVGTAMAMPSNEVTLGDVAVATRIGNVTVGLFAQVGEHHQSVHKDVIKWASNFQARAAAGWSSPKSTGAAPTVPDRFAGYSLMQDQVASSLKQHFHVSQAGESRIKLRPPRVVAGLFVSANGTLDNSKLHDLWVGGGRNILAIETSTADAYAAARAGKLPLMSIRGISEVAGLERDPDWVAYAGKMAASFALAFLKGRPIAPHPSAPHEKSTNESPPNRPINLTNIFCVSKLTLSDVRGFRHLDLSLRAPASRDTGQWTILLGNNGVGKTTILRALALALAPADVAPLVLSRTGPVSPTVRTGTDTATIQVGVTGEEQVTILDIEPTQGGERLKRLRYAHLSMPFLVAYGSRRGSGLAGSARGANPSSAAAVETLFDEGANLIQPDVWLMGWQLAALQSPDSQDARFFHAILATLCAVLPDVKQIHVSREAVEVEGPSIGRVPLGALSDGYRTTMGWILDMIARWVEEARRRNLPIDGDFHEKMTGVVLIDEIDLHLHPRWQRDVISVVRGHFPRMSFVVTTHNPLTLLGARPGEIHVLTRTEQGDVNVEQRDLPPGIDAEQVLTGDWFGLASTLDDATLAKLAEHQRMILEKGLEAPEALEREEELRRILGSYGGTSIERLAQAAAARVIDKDIRRLTPDERRDAQAKIAELLREDLPGSSKPVVTKKAAARGARAQVKAVKPAAAKQKTTARRARRPAR